MTRMSRSRRDSNSCATRLACNLHLDAREGLPFRGGHLLADGRVLPPGAGFHQQLELSQCGSRDIREACGLAGLRGIFAIGCLRQVAPRSRFGRGQRCSEYQG